MTGKKWNNQGGSNFGNQNRQNRNQKNKGLPSVPKFDDLRESDVTSFRLIKAKPSKPNYGQFGDAVWTLDLFPEDEYIDLLKEEYEIPDLDIPLIRPFRSPPLTRIDPENNPDLFPDFVLDEYEIVVKFYQQSVSLGIVLTIMSGQAYAARNNINDPRLDLAIVIVSSAPILINQNATNISATVNIIRLLNSSQDPIYSLYNWIISKLAITTKNNGTTGETLFDELDITNDAILLPSISFIALNNGLQCGLFYSDQGLQPKQICIHAIDKVLKFRTSTDESEYWSTLYATTPRTLCLTLNQLPVVSIRFKSGTPQSLKWNEGIFWIEVYLLEPLDYPIEIDIVVSGTADTDKYVVNGLEQGFGRRYVTFPALSTIANISIETMSNPDEIADKIVNIAIDQLSANSVYEIGTSDVTATITPSSQAGIELVSITGNNIIDSGGTFSLTVLINRISNSDLTIDLIYDSFFRSADYIFPVSVPIPSGSLSASFEIISIVPVNNYSFPKSFDLQAISTQADGLVFINLTVNHKPNALLFRNTRTEPQMPGQVSNGRFVIGNFRGSNTSLTTFTYEWSGGNIIPPSTIPYVANDPNFIDSGGTPLPQFASHQTQPSSYTQYLFEYLNNVCTYNNVRYLYIHEIVGNFGTFAPSIPFVQSIMSAQLRREFLDWSYFAGIDGNIIPDNPDQDPYSPYYEIDNSETYDQGFRFSFHFQSGKYTPTSGPGVGSTFDTYLSAYCFRYDSQSISGCRFINCSINNTNAPLFYQPPYTNA